MTAQDASTFSMRKSAGKGAVWLSAASLVGAVSQYFQLGLLAWAVSPEGVGALAAVSVAVGLGTVLSDLGIGNALVHFRPTENGTLSSLFWINACAAFLTATLFFVFADPIAAAFGVRGHTLLFRITGLFFLIVPFGRMYQMLLQRDLRFKAVAVSEMVGKVVGLAVFSGYLAFRRDPIAGIWALLADGVVRTVIVVSAGVKIFRPRAYFSHHNLHEIFRYGLYQTAEHGIGYLVDRLDHIIVGMLLGPSALGLYSLAYSLIAQPVVRIAPVLMRVAFPVFSTLRAGRSQLRSAYYRVLELLSLLLLPVVFFIAALADVFIPLLLGKEWESSIPIVMLFSFVYVGRIISYPLGVLLSAKGWAARSFFLSLSALIVQALLMYPGAVLYGLPGVVFSLILVQALFFGVEYVFLLRPALGRSFAEMVGSLRLAFVVSIAAVIGVTAAKQLWPDRFGDTSLLVAAALVGIAAVAAVGLLFGKQTIRRYIDEVKASLLNIS